VKVNFVAGLKLAELLAGNLNCLSGDVNKRVIDFNHIEELSGSANDAFLVEVYVELIFLRNKINTNRTMSAYVRISNFLLLKRKGLEIYFWMRKRLPFLHYFSTCCLISL
jgi:hypothetical protein